MMLALKCLASKGARLTMQQVATEIRLLGILLRQHEANAKNEPAPAPFLVTPAQPAAAAQSASCRPNLARTRMAPLPIREMEAAVEKMLAPGETGAAPVVPLGRDSFGRPDAEGAGRIGAGRGPLPEVRQPGGVRVARRARDSSRCCRAGGCRSAAATGAITATWYLRGSRLRRICLRQSDRKYRPRQRNY